MPDSLTVTILDSGTCRIETDAISGPNHQLAEAALLWIARELGGEVTRTRRVTIGQTLTAHAHDHETADHTH